MLHVNEQTNELHFSRLHIQPTAIMASLLSLALRMRQPQIQPVTTHLLSIRTARQLTPVKYFRPRKQLTPLEELREPNSPLIPPIPPYPYGPNRNYPLADTGLYGGRKVLSGNKISKGRTKSTTRRKWYPRVQVRKLKSDAMDKEFSLKVTAACMRTIRKCGGLDQYLLGHKPARLKELGLLGWNLRWRVMCSPVMKERFREERKKLGLTGPAVTEEIFEDAAGNRELRTQWLEQLDADWEKLRMKEKKFMNHWGSQLQRIKGDEYEFPTIMKPQTLMDYSPKDLGEAFDELPKMRELLKKQADEKEEADEKRARLSTTAGDISPAEFLESSVSRIDAEEVPAMPVN